MYGTMARMVKTTVYLTPELKARLERMASETEASEADLIRQAVERITRDHHPRPRLGLAESGAPIEDWDEALRGLGS